jgi:hypothetical protein
VSEKCQTSRDDMGVAALKAIIIFKVPVYSASMILHLSPAF